MAEKKIFFLKKEEMLAKFKEIKDADPPMTREEGFYNFLVGFASTETNERHLVLIITLALGCASGNYPINLSRHLEALVEDISTIRSARKILENASFILKEKNSTGRIILA